MAPSSADTLKSLLKPQPAHASRDMPIEADSIHGRLPRSTKSAALEKRVWLSQNNRPQGPGLKRTAEVSTESGNTLKKKPKLPLVQQDKKPPHQNVQSGRGKSVTTMSRAKQLYEKSAIVEQDAAEDEDEDEEDSEDGGDNRFLPNDSDDSGEKDDIDELKDLDEEDLTRERVKVVGKKGGYNKRGSLIQMVHGDDVDFIPPPSQPASLTNNNDSSYCSESEASSRVDLSMMPDNYDSEEDEPAPIAKQKVSKARDAKYIAELPAIVPPPMETRVIQKPIRKQVAHSRISYTSHVTAAMTADPNDDWPNLTALIYPRQQRVISLTAQTQTIQRVLHEAINLAIGLAIFQNGFAPTAQQLADSKNSIMLAATKFELPEIVYRFERDDLYARHLITYVTGRVGHMRGKVKYAAQELVPSMYGIHQIPVENNARKSFVADLLTKMNFIFPWTNVAESSTICTSEPYRHPAIVAVMRKYFFSGHKSLGHRFHDTFSSSVNSNSSKEIPRAMLGIVVVAIFAALKEWSEGCDQRMTQDFVSAEFSDEYDLHMSLLQSRIYKEDGSGKHKYHSLMSWLYCEARMGEGSNIKASSDKMPELDFDGMDG
ncbi:hypothetical protein DFH05DRAFT_1593878 [Lentinula detonsa]|uniref:DUF6532 domain-containing protein n=1 Tax=Lentinula detonsa TaxID=2804962 RepID=A0A9W8U1R7_9AGAR|nr:hypothetical protein DFH05DRAFT_1593878 [Lentinula detonsa]